MIYAYGITQQGTYHVKKGIVCQDAHRFIKCGDSYGIAAVADGLGSEEHSDIASQLAVALSTEYCAEHIQENLPELFYMIQPNRLLSRNLSGNLT